MTPRDFFSFDEQMQQIDDVYELLVTLSGDDSTRWPS